MENRKIILSVKRSQFRCDDPSRDMADEQFQLIRPSILERDKGRCVFCNFHSDKFQEVHHLGSHSDNSESNLVTACPLCHSCHHIGFAGSQEQGSLIYIDPSYGVTQEMLNQLVRSLWVAHGDASEASVGLGAISMLSRLYKCTVAAKRHIGTSSPVVLGDFLLGLNEEEYEKREEKLRGIYFLPFKDGYIRQVEYWTKKTYKNIPASMWSGVAEDKLKRWAENEKGKSSVDILAVMLGIDI